MAQAACACAVSGAEFGRRVANDRVPGTGAYRTVRLTVGSTYRTQNRSAGAVLLGEGGDELHAVAYVELAEDVAEVGFHGPA
jgi:hypothetical protein